MAQPDPNAATSTPAAAEAQHLGGVLGEATTGDRRRQVRLGHGLAGHCRRRGSAEGPETAVGDADDGQQRDGGPTADQRDGNHALGEERRRGRALHHHLTRQAVPEDATEQHGDHLGQRVRRHHEPELCRGAAQVEHREGQGHGGDGAAEAADVRSGDEVAVVAVAES